MSVVKQLQKCPFCLEPIMAGATRCKHCQADMVARKNQKKSRLARYQTFRMGFLVGMLFSLTVALLAWAHVFWGEG
ncbi:MAG: hypothetical protein OEV49_09660 [candidate division Zixibacteria bacterium]|nr:hypothetical protein [candidate division Zixibacteria bacterium]MDH3937716.1 hypothetical protein [candidate division Zixibacteria bacterium]MDH4034510.1 hypothetical protein [candidate division Zixibacteria bacterium]